jgi:hypothetical protein
MLIEQPALISFLKQVNGLRRAPGEHHSTSMRSALENVAATLFGCSKKLAVYGSLRPGEENHSVIEDLDGTWCNGFVRGKLFESGWGAAIGYPVSSSKFTCSSQMTSNPAGHGWMTSKVTNTSAYWCPSRTEIRSWQ